jgi:PAS domain S-box-containing protein
MESEARYRLLAQNMGDMIVLTGPDRVRTYVSPTCWDLLGYEPEELIGRTAEGIIHPDDANRVEAEFKRLLASGDKTPTTSVHRLRHKDGHWVHIEARRRPLTDDDGKLIGVISVARDISERMELEERLRRAQRMEAVGQLTGGISHDFNNLLTVILGNAEILAEDMHDPQFQPLAEMIREAAEKGASLTQHLLAFSRRQTLKPTRVSLREVVHGMEPLLRRTIDATVDLTTEFSDGDATALADKTLLESALLNLVVNARDAMPQGGTLTIKTGRRMAGANEGNLNVGQPVVFVSVTDTGTGMPPEVLARAFEPFFTTKEVGKGSGLGLSMVYGFTQQSGAYLNIDSKEGSGTSVTIVLQQVSPEPTVSEGKAPVVEAGRERVLVVEDESAVLLFVTGQLRSLGYAVEAVSAGEDAIKLLERNSRFDLLFTDVMLPKGMSGVELARRARAIRPELKVLLTSGYPEEIFTQHGRPDEGIPLLRKPYRRKELAEMIRKCLDRGL